MDMALTHVGIYLSGAATTAVMVFFYERLFARHTSTGLRCDDCRRAIPGQDVLP